MKGMSFQLLVIIAMFVIILVVALFFLTAGKQYIYDAINQAFNLFGKKA